MSLMGAQRVACLQACVFAFTICYVCVCICVSFHKSFNVSVWSLIVDMQYGGCVWEVHLDDHTYLVSSRTNMFPVSAE